MGGDDNNKINKHMQTVDLTAFQLRAARRALGLSYNDIFKHTGVAVSALFRMESSDLDKFPEHSSPVTVYRVRAFLEEQGIEFREDNWIRLLPSKQNLDIRVKVEK